MRHDDSENSPSLVANDPVERRSSSRPALSRAVQAEIGQRLRHFYDTLALGQNPIPERFIAIIDRLEAEPEERVEKHS